MKIRGVAILASLILVLLVSTPRTQGQTSGIIVNDADAISDLALAASSLNPSIEPRFVVQYANAMRFYNLPPIPPELLILIRQVKDRVVIQYANSVATHSLVYPHLDDFIPPIISDVEAFPIACGRVAIQWTTNEFADSVISYGKQPEPAPYTETFTDPLYFKGHNDILDGLELGLVSTRYYFKVSSTDRSGNMTTTVQLSLLTRAPCDYFTYLPIVTNNYNSP